MDCNDDLLKLGLSKIYDSDTFLCSYPKSGNTWVRFLVANLLEQKVEIAFRNIDDYVPEIQRRKEHLNRLSKRSLMKTHWPLFYLFPKTIYICRDPRDAYISYYHYTISNEWFIGSLSHFLRSSVPEYYGNWGTHVEMALNHQETYPDRIEIIKYEDLLHLPGKILTLVADFLGINYDDSSIDVAIHKCSLNNLRNLEVKHGPETSRASGFFRKGQSGEWREILSKEDSLFLTHKFYPSLLKLGYSIE